MDTKEKQLAKTIVDYSLNIKKGDRVLITYQSLDANNFVKELITSISSKDAIAMVCYEDVSLSAYLKQITTSKRIELIKKYKEFELSNFDVFINIKYNINDYENTVNTTLLTSDYTDNTDNENERRKGLK